MRLVSFFVRSVVAIRKVEVSTEMSLSPPKVNLSKNGEEAAKLDRGMFNKKIGVPTIAYSGIHSKSMTDIMRSLKKYFIKLEKFHPVSNGKIYLNPEKVKNWEDLPTDTLASLKIPSSAFTIEEIELTYENWRADELVKAILPDDIEPATSFSKIGHILHMNLKDNLLPYKTAIAQIFMDKTPGCRTVINKAASIDNTFRNFQIDLLLGDADYQAQVKENGVSFEFDFSSVYWNPRLSSEHERLVKRFRPNDYFYDVFAGVGPFAVPAGKKRVNVLANDLNPESYKWLAHNVEKNKIERLVKTFNKDGRDFIKDEIRSNLIERIEKRDSDMVEYAIHIAMNLPALAVTFLDAFVGLLKDNGKGIENSRSIPVPICHCYCFVKGVDDKKLMAQNLVEENLGFKLVRNETLKDVIFVRNVAPNKDMMRVDLLLTSEILFDTMPAKSKRSPEEASHDVPSKKQCN